ncbi:DEKNAAC101820 [Brettanomyces naardenensis]|uniref:DEKNAAC101820 n=1 Tax=Brettanomyces naardenensis TaxID=13370 RepID=A0A448YJ68_BRENA|nr:DEKNAAC101820 [Brettanomyces naardenensis]
MTEPAELNGVKYPAKKHALKVKGHFLSKKTTATAANSAFFIAGTSLVYYEYCDETIALRQNRYFHYLTGVDQIPGCFILFTLADDKSTLYLPEIDWEDVMWSGMPINPKEAAAKFDVDEVKYVSDLKESLQNLKSAGVSIYTPDTKEYSKEPFADLVTPGDKDLFYALDEARLIKDSYEIAMMKHANKITANSHIAVMSAQPIEKNETHIHAEFVYHSIRQGSKVQSYSPICCTGPNCGTLHYVKNDDSMADKFSTLIDAGADWGCYASDVTRCFPINGDWTKEHLDIYETVRDMQKSVMDAVKPGVSWESMHMLAHKVLIKHFLKLGLFKDGTPEEILDSKVSVWFFPHGLGHLLGLDTHDVGGYPDYEDADIYLRWLRLRRKLQAGMVVTDEPGVYFSDYLIDLAYKDPKQAKYIDREVVKKYMYVGGVRIEDDLLITKDGYENLTVVTSDPDEISKIVKKGLARGREGFHVVV